MEEDFGAVAWRPKNCLENLHSRHTRQADVRTVTEYAQVMLKVVYRIVMICSYSQATLRDLDGYLVSLVRRASLVVSTTNSG